MVGATTTAVRCITWLARNSAIRRSFESLRCGPCSLDSAPSGIMTTAPGFSTAAASFQDRSARRTLCVWAKQEAAKGRIGGTPIRPIVYNGEPAGSQDWQPGFAAPQFNGDGLRTVASP